MESRSVRLLMPLLALPLSAAVAQVTGSQHPLSPPGDRKAPLEVFRAPQPKPLAEPVYPIEERRNGNEGWVNLNFMVSPEGKPYELAITASTGNKELEKAALKAAERWEFVPGSLNGMPIDAAFEIKVVFVLTNGDVGANREFAKGYRAVRKAIADGDQGAALATLEKLQVRNLYEDAYLGLIRYFYFVKWGNEEQQLGALRRAVAKEKSAVYLSKDYFTTALQSVWQLETKTKDYAGAMDTWKKLQAAGIEDEKLARMKRAIDEMEILRTDGRAYSVPGDLAEGSWHYTLFKDDFQIVVTRGAVSQIKLRCDRSYVFFEFDPTLTYSVADNAGTCHIELVGEPDTHVNLIQS